MGLTRLSFVPCLLFRVCRTGGNHLQKASSHLSLLSPCPHLVSEAEEPGRKSLKFQVKIFCSRAGRMQPRAVQHSSLGETPIHISVSQQGPEHQRFSCAETRARRLCRPVFFSSVLQGRLTFCNSPLLPALAIYMLLLFELEAGIASACILSSGIIVLLITVTHALVRASQVSRRTRSEVSHTLYENDSAQTALARQRLAVTHAGPPQLSQLQRRKRNT
uniref:Transmembrane protein 221 n=1 Tax=Buteo japonicus TaxID=224669 RepID=A0A8C0BMA8_9AVES